MIVDAWLTSLMVQPPVILGRRLKPFSLAHSFILERAENPFWTGGERGPEHFFEALEICSRDLSENRARVSCGIGKRFARWVAGKFRKVSKGDVETFVKYMDDHLVCCSREGEGGGREMGSPWQFRLVVDLVAAGFTEERAWNMPLNLARCYYDARAEMQGEATLVSTDSEQAYELIAAANRLMEEGKTKEADELYAIAQAEFDKRNRASAAAREALNV